MKHEVFDEIRDDDVAIVGAVHCGGQAKNSWLGTPHIVFESKPLQEFLTNYRLFHKSHKEHKEAALDQDSKDAKDILDNFERGIQRNPYELLSYFDDILNDPETDWNGSDSNDTLIKQNRACDKHKRVLHFREDAVWGGAPWRGAAPMPKDNPNTRPQTKVTSKPGRRAVGNSTTTTKRKGSNK